MKINLKDDKALLIHMDDMGMSYAANMAGMDLFKKGIARSASVMVPCPWAYDFIKWCRENPQYDVGIHMTHTSEWDTARWRGLASAREAPGLYDEEGFLCRGFNREVDGYPPEQVILEMQMQFDQAVKWGLKPTHIDTHMFGVAGSLQSYGAYMNLAAEHGIPAPVPGWSLWDEDRRRLAESSGMPVIDASVSTGDSLDYETRKKQLYENLKLVKPGLNVLVIHPVADTPEIRSIIPSWEYRVMEYRLFMDEDTAGMLEELGILSITWQDVGLTFSNCQNAGYGL